MFITTVALPLSAGKIVIVLFLFRALRDWYSRSVIFALGGLAVLKILDTSCRISSAVCSFIVDSVASMLETISSFGIVLGAIAKLKPLLKTWVSVSESGWLEVL